MEKEVIKGCSTCRQNKEACFKECDGEYSGWKPEEKYWENIEKIYHQQTDKGISKYGQVLEQNKKMTPVERIVYLQEELVDALMYCEHIKNDNYNGIDADDYQKAALRTASSNRPGDLILNGVLGLGGESGEVADHVKKHLFQGHSLDKEKVAKELGDICWYVAIAAEGIGYKLSDILKMNVQKLLDRYPDGFEAERSLNRKEEE